MAEPKEVLREWRALVLGFLAALLVVGPPFLSSYWVGLLTQAATLSLSSDGTRHRPVHRGVWVSEAIFGRTGLLAHTYMLGPNGDSNGCVSFKDYYAFLNAYRNGGIKRLAVVAKVE